MYTRSEGWRSMRGLSRRSSHELGLLDRVRRRSHRRNHRQCRDDVHFDAPERITEPLTAGYAAVIHTDVSPSTLILNNAPAPGDTLCAGVFSCPTLPRKPIYRLCHVCKRRRQKRRFLGPGYCSASPRICRSCRKSLLKDSPPCLPQIPQSEKPCAKPASTATQSSTTRAGTAFSRSMDWPSSTRPKSLQSESRGRLFRRRETFALSRRIHPG